MLINASFSGELICFANDADTLYSNNKVRPRMLCCTPTSHFHSRLLFTKIFEANLLGDTISCNRFLSLVSSFTPYICASIFIDPGRAQCNGATDIVAALARRYSHLQHHIQWNSLATAIPLAACSFSRP